MAAVRVAVISDIHADLPALERVLSAIDRVAPDETWCLGDVVGLGGNDPAGVVDLVRETCSVVLAGNHDAWVTGELPLDLLPLPRQRTELTWQRAELSDDQLAWLAGLPTHAQRAGVELWHGSADDPLMGWLSTHTDAIAHLDRQRAAIGLVGHTHRPAVGHRRRGIVRFTERPPQRVELERKGRWVINPGAVTGAGAWLELDITAAEVSWHRN